MKCQVDKNGHFRHRLLVAFKRGDKATEAAQQIREMYGEEAMPDRTAQNWFKRFKNGNFDLKDSARSGRPVEFDENRLNQLIHENPRRTTRELAEIMKTSHTTVERHLHSMGKVQKLGAWVPHSMSDNNKNQRSTLSDGLLGRHHGTHVHKDLDCSEYGSIDLANHTDGFDKEDDEDDDQLECERDKIVPTSMSTTDSLLAAVTAASSSTKTLRSPSKRLRHERNLSPTNASSSKDVSISQKAPLSAGSLNLDSGLLIESRDRTSQQKGSTGLRPQFGAKQPLVIKTNGANNLKKFETACSTLLSPKLVGGAHATATVTASLSKNLNVGAEEGDADANKFKFFGNYVESALLDLNQQSPTIARLLVQSIYQTIADHQSQLKD